MGELHDEWAIKCGEYILKKIRESDKQFKQIFSASTARMGDWGWPRPDFVCYDPQLKASYAMEFKPPYQSKREYLTGLGQALAYLHKHAYSALILPRKSLDGYDIADFVKSVLDQEEFKKISISLFVYDFDQNGINNVEILHNIKTVRESSPKIKHSKDIETFWSWWRDMSNYELYDLLNLSFQYSDIPGDIYTEYIYPEFYKRVKEGKTKQWDGSPRTKRGTSASEKSEKQNYRIPLEQLGLFQNKDGHITDKGIQLLIIGKRYGPDSKAFLNALARLLLVDGKHLELIRMIDQYQKDKKDNIPKNSLDYKKDLDAYLTEKGCIGKRKPTAVTTDKKGSYLRDEMKLWNKLGLLKTSGSGEGKYFVKNVGYTFDYDAITSCLANTN